MPNPSSSTAVQRPDLGMAVQEYMDDGPTMGFIGTRVMPLFYTAEQSSQFPVIPKEALLSVPDTKRAMRGFYNRGDWEFEEGFYSTKENGWEEPVDDREEKLYRNKFSAELMATKRATGIILRAQEQRISSKVFNASTFTANPVDNEWDDQANCTPIDDINAGKKAVRSACGLLPNTLIISYSTLVDLRRSSQIVELMKYTFPGQDINSMSPGQLAQIFDIEQVLVGGAVWNSAKKGQNAAIADLWSKEYAMLTITSESEDISEPCIGRTFLWTEESDENTVVEDYREEGSRSNVIRVRHDTDERLIRSYDEDGAVVSDIATQVSYLLSNITT